MLAKYASPFHNNMMWARNFALARNFAIRSLLAAYTGREGMLSRLATDRCIEYRKAYSLVWIHWTSVPNGVKSARPIHTIRNTALDHHTAR